MTLLFTANEAPVTYSLESIWLSTKVVSDYCQNGVRWAMVADVASTPKLKFLYSLNGTSYTQVPAMDVVAWHPQFPFGMYIDKDDFMYIYYTKPPVYPAAYGSFVFRRCTPNSARTSYSLGPEITVYSTFSSSPAMKMVVHRYGTGWKAHCVVGGAGYTPYWAMYGVSSSGTIALEAANSLTAAQGRDIEIDFHHKTDDPKEVLGSDPHLYIVQNDPQWNGSTYVSMIRPAKVTHSGGVWTLQTGTNPASYGAGSVFSYGGFNGYWDGSRFVCSVTQSESPGEVANVYVFEWDGVPSSTPVITQNPYTHTAAISGTGVSYNRVNQDLYLFILDEAGKVWKRVYSRAGGSWAAAAEILTIPGYVEAASGSNEESFASFCKYDSPTDSQIWMIALSGNAAPWSYYVESVQTFNLPPLSPEPQYPANNAYVPIAGAWNLLFRYRDPNPADTCHSWQLRRRVGAGAWSYWNAAGAAWQAGEVWNTAATNYDISVAFGAGKWANGTTYGWMARTRDPLLTVGPWMDEQFVNGSLAPTVVVTGPTGVVGTTQKPTISWTYADAESHPQQKYRTKVFSSAEYGAGGFDPETSSPTWDSGEKAGAVGSYAISEELDNGLSYRSYVKVAQAGDQWSTWDYEEFSIALDPPAQCMVTQTAVPASGRMDVAVQCRENMLSANTASIETNAGGWTAGASTTAARVTAQAKNGSASLRLTRTGTLGTASAFTPTGTNGVPVVPGKQYTALASFRAVATARQCRANISWYTAAGALISTTNGNQVADATGNFNAQSVCTAVSPPTAAFAAITVEVLSAAVNEQHYVDAISLAPGNSTTWSRGGSIPSVELSRKVGSGEWTVVRNGSSIQVNSLADQVANYLDYEVPFGVTVSYRARTLIEV